MEKERKIHLLIISLLILIIILSFFLRLVPIRLSHSWDETVYLQHAEVFFSGRTNYDELAFRPPLLSILFYLGYFIYHSVITATIIVALLGALGVLIIFLIGKKVYNEKVGLLAVAIFALSPFLIKNSNLIMADVPVATLLGVSFYFALFRDKKWMIFLSGLFLGLSILMKFIAVAIIPVFIIYYLMYREELDINKILFFGAGFLIAMTPYFIWNQIKFGNIISPLIRESQMVSVRDAPTFFYFYNLQNIFTYLIIIGLALWLVNLIIKFRKKEDLDIRIALIFTIWIIVFLAYLTQTPHKLLRFLIPISIPIILLASKGIMLTLNKVKEDYKIFYISLIILYLGFLVYSTTNYKDLSSRDFINEKISDDRRAAEFILNELNYSGIIYSHQAPLIAYYSGLNTTPVWMGNNKNLSEAVSSTMKEPGIFIGAYYFEKATPPQRQPTSSWMRNDSRFTHLKDIGSDFIFRYDPESK